MCIRGRRIVEGEEEEVCFVVKKGFGPLRIFSPIKSGFRGLQKS